MKNNKEKNSQFSIFNSQLIISVCLMLLLTNSAISQSVAYYSYDFSGNRIGKNVIQFAPVLSPPPTEDEDFDEEVFIKDALYIFTETIETMEVKIYPNPTKGKLIVEINSEEPIPEVNINIFTVSGQAILRHKTRHEESVSRTTIDLTPHKSGVYVMKIETTKHTSEWKIIKE